MSQKPVILKILEKLSKELSMKLLVEPDYQDAVQITFKSGKKAFVNTREFNINKASSSRISQDKDYTTFFLGSFGYSVPQEKIFFSHNLCKLSGNSRNIDDGYEFAKTIGFPLMLKPNNLSKGEMVTKVYNKRDYYSVAKKIFMKSSIMIVQKFYPGRDYRIVVLNGEVISAYERIHLNIIGDGQSNVKELIEQKQKSFFEKGRNTIIDIHDFRLKNKLKIQKLSFDSIVEKGEKVYLLDNANLSSGGDVSDFTDGIHPDFKELAINITKDMDLNLCGVDILTEDITKPINKDNYVVIEINSAPGLGNYASIGKVQEKKVEELYRKVILSID